MAPGTTQIPLLLLPIVVWLALGLGLMVAFRRSPSPLLLRLAAIFTALWALLATTALVALISLRGAYRELLAAPGQFGSPSHLGVWEIGALGAFVLLTIAFLVNQLVGRGWQRLLRPEPVPWPGRLVPPVEPTSLYQYASDRLEAFSFTILERHPGRWRLRRHEMILISEALRERLNPEELEAVVAHELGHVRDLDARYLTFFRTFARMMRWDPVLAFLSARLTSQEEFRADEEAVRMTRRPRALARALLRSMGEGVAVPAAFGPSTGLFGPSARRMPPEVARRIERLLALADRPEYRDEEPVDGTRA